MKLRMWYFTFGRDHKHRGKVQPIQAHSMLQARNEMMRRYGLGWSLACSEKEWKDWQEKCIVLGYDAETELETIYLDGLGEVIKCM